MQQMMIGLYTAPPSSGGALILDATPYLEDDASLSTNEHGYEALSGSLRRRLAHAVRTYQLGAVYVGAFAGGVILWEGRLEDPALFADDTGSGNTINALGSWRALTDTTYTALWSTTNVTEWRPIIETENANRAPKLYVFDTNNRLFTGLTKGTVYRNANDTGDLTLVIPDQSSRQIIGISFDYAVLLPNNWGAALQRWTSAFAFQSAPWVLATTGVLQTGSINLTFAGCDRLGFTINNNTGANYNFVGENGTNYLRVTNLRIVTATANRINTTLGTIIAAGTRTVTPASMARIFVGQRLNIGGAISESVVVTAITATTFTAVFAQAHVAADTVQAHVVYGDEIATDLVNTVNALNSSQLSSNTTLIQSPGLDLTDEVFEDELPSDILTYLTGLGDNATPPHQWETGVWEGRVLFFRPQNSASRTWYVDVSDLTVERSLEDMANSAYATYQEPGGRTLRIAVVSDSTSIARAGLTRRAALSARTTSSTEAGIQRDAFLQDRKDPFPRAQIMFDRVYDASGVRCPLGFVRAGDTIVIRNLPSFVAVALDRVRSFRITHTAYKPATRTLSVEPERPLPALETLLAREAIGVRTTVLPIDKNA